MFKFAGFVLALISAVGVGGAQAEAPATPSPPTGQAGTPTVTVFAAASLKNALDAAASAFKDKTGIELKISYAGSMALAKQIESAAPAEVFIAADEASMDYLAARGLIQPTTRANLLGNRLVVIAPKAAALEKLPFTREAFFGALGSGKLATGDPASVPVGRYAKSSLEKLGLWSLVESNLALTDNVRAALAFVAREEAPLGIVYFTDAKSEKKVKIVATFPADTHPPIIYPIALTSTALGDPPAKLLAFLRSKAAQEIFSQQGFSVMR